MYCPDVIEKVYQASLYYLPLYYQNARGWSPIASAAMTCPMVAAKALQEDCRDDLIFEEDHCCMSIECPFITMGILELFFKNKVVSAIFLQSFLYGAVYQASLYYLPLYYQIECPFITMGILELTW
jgi:hypothetical protein